MAIIKNLQTINDIVGMEKREASCTFSEKAMAPHSSTLAWKIPWMEELGRLQSMGSPRVGHNSMTEQHDPTIPLLGICPEETITEKDTYPQYSLQHYLQ